MAHIPAPQQSLMSSVAVQRAVTLAWTVSSQWWDHRIVGWVRRSQHLRTLTQPAKAASQEMSAVNVG